MWLGIATLFGRSTFVGAFETAVVIGTTAFVAVFFVIAMSLPDVAVALTTPNPLEVVTISGLKAATT
jgi:hypothetical protein